MSAKAIVTIALGEKYLGRWRSVCENNWIDYATRIGADLIVFDQPLDGSNRATCRSPSWQKLLILEDPKVCRYGQVAWIDADVLINPTCDVSIFQSVPEERVGAVDSFADPSPAENQKAMERYWRLFVEEWGGDPNTGYLTPEEVYRDYDPGMTGVGRMLNAGVLVASPAHHAAIFRKVYDSYEETSENARFIENVPLSYHLVAGDLVHWLDVKFNHLWLWSMIQHYPFLCRWRSRSFADKILRRIAYWMGNDYERRVATACVTTALLNCHFLHFAGYGGDMQFADLSAAAHGLPNNLGV